MTTNTVSAKKITKKDNFTRLLTIPEVKNDETLRAFVEHELELLANKAAGNSEKKPSATQQENTEIKKAILRTMELGKMYTITDLQKTVPECAEISNQRVTAIVRQLLPETGTGEVIRTKEKDKTYFTLA